MELDDETSKGVKADNQEHWFTTAPVAEQERQQDTVTTYAVMKNSEGIACCSTKES